MSQEYLTTKTRPSTPSDVARIPIEDTDSFDMEEAKLFEDTARHRGDEVTLTMLKVLQAKGNCASGPG